MKKLFLVAFGILILSLGRAAQAAPEPAPSPPNRQQNLATAMMVELDHIQVPQEVLFRLQAVYQGFAATRASQFTKDGQQFYRLRVDRDDVANDYESFYLVYDHEWQFVREEKTAPPPEPEPAPEPAPQPEPAEEEPGEDDKPRNRLEVPQEEEPDSDSDTDSPAEEPRRGRDRE